MPLARPSSLPWFDASRMPDFDSSPLCEGSQIPAPRCSASPILLRHERYDRTSTISYQLPKAPIRTSQ